MKKQISKRLLHDLKWTARSKENSYLLTGDEAQAILNTLEDLEQDAKRK